MHTLGHVKDEQMEIKAYLYINKANPDERDELKVWAGDIRKKPLEHLYIIHIIYSLLMIWQYLFNDMYNI